ncbi:MAG: S46 family peptidase [Ignavibacteriales bacterium]|nr:S46 family peptidase [Ignavibacteriales bacterium]
MNKLKNLFIILFVTITLLNTSLAQTYFYEPLDLETITWSLDDFGKMWTFHSVPLDKFEKKYEFRPTQEWLDDVQKSALQFGGGCSAAFVSGDGLIMTNHHCGRDQLYTIQKECENLLKDGFYAENLDEERKLDGLFVDQLILIEDVTKIVQDYMAHGETDNQKIKFKEEIKDSLIKKYNEETNLNCRIVTLYNGGKYSLYGYKRYNDIRLVMAPDFQIAATGWDWDNFTYPRYELDFMFYRAYDENGKPVKNKNYFTWSKNGAREGDPIFTVGRPGSTDRLKSYSELKYLRDFVYPKSLIGFNSIYQAYFDLYNNHLDREVLLNSVMRWGNSRKSYAGRLAGLNNEIIMKKKLDFENDLKLKVKTTPELNEKYGEIWNSIDIVINELENYSDLNTVTRFNRFAKPVYFSIASDLIKLAEEKKLPEDERNQKYKEENIEETISNIYPDSIDNELQLNLLKAHNTFITKILGYDDELVKILYSQENVNLNEIIKNSKLGTKESVLQIAKLNGEEILKLDDPFIQYIISVDKISDEINPKVKELNNTLDVLNQSLGELISLIYKNKISPDATSTLRISDGVIKSYEYNGTIAPGKTTYYGLWDRYESFNEKTYPWGLHERWKTPPKDLDLKTFIAFASTNDIVGGNSGSSIINKDQEVVGLAHDGNLESLAGHTIYWEENNRTVATDSDGLMQALVHVYKTERLVDELLNGGIK